MLLVLQITFTILSALCVAAFVPVGAFWGWMPAIGFALAAVMFFMLMKLCKQSLEFKAEPEQKTEPDFFNPPQKDENTDKNNG